MIISNPPPRKLPPSLQGDEYAERLNEVVYQLWFSNQGNKSPNLINSVEGVDATQTGQVELLDVPLNKNFIPLSVVVRVTSFDLGSKSVNADASFGSNVTFDDFIAASSFAFNSDDVYMTAKPSDLIELPVQTPQKKFSVDIKTASNADEEIWGVDLFGYFI